MTLKLNGSSSGSVSLDAPASTTSGADITFNLPVADGSSGQALTTNASGQLAFSSITPRDAASVAKVWIRMDGTGTISINGSYGVSSITDNGTGDYTINFSSAFSDTNYCVVTGMASYTLGDADRRFPVHVEAVATGSVTVHNVQVSNNGSLVDGNFICLAIFDS
tara:strand:+ start:511 stop:1005 length:495 start_codon:yes stop_codon:yes gene_type:complete